MRANAPILTFELHLCLTFLWACKTANVISWNFKYYLAVSKCDYEVWNKFSVTDSSTSRGKLIVLQVWMYWHWISSKRFNLFQSCPRPTNRALNCHRIIIRYISYRFFTTVYFHRCKFFAKIFFLSILIIIKEQSGAHSIWHESQFPPYW